MRQGWPTMAAELLKADAHGVATQRDAQKAEANHFPAGTELRHLEENDHGREDEHAIVDQEFSERFGSQLNAG